MRLLDCSSPWDFINLLVPFTTKSPSGMFGLSNPFKRTRSGGSSQAEDENPPIPVAITRPKKKTKGDKCQLCDLLLEDGDADPHDVCTKPKQLCRFTYPTETIQSLRTADGDFRCHRCQCSFVNARSLVVHCIDCPQASASATEPIQPSSIYLTPTSQNVDLPTEEHMQLDSLATSFTFLGSEDPPSLHSLCSLP
ncbi:hypothetical protein PILCRDRAFT_15786 [Piloderma croceum F 1598]|uniref:Uncharacterized protein n=1 Tax=Piloderma croceum (strain F 1598) TaxID=765440 RepID=A0A0C3AG59_PILCF|nr:hypothetical protein PILCRDRAFT_15786 [Piloderma croceum F 1598]